MISETAVADESAPSATVPSSSGNAADPASIAATLRDYRARIDSAQVYAVADVTPLQEAHQLGRRLDCRIWLKREDLQPVHSFKLRGAYNKVVQLSEAERARGVICASAGNHAQGVALAGQRLGIPAWIVMPRTTPQIKVDAVRALGARAVLHGDAYDDAAARARELAEEQGLTPVHPFDDPAVIAGQGTIAREILEQLGDSRLDAIFVPVGGGGLLAGIAAWVKAVRPGVKVIGVEPDDSACMAQALSAGERVVLKQVGLFADGVAVRQAGAETFRLAQLFVDACIQVSVDEICAAVRDLFYECRAVPEPAGALALAGIKRWVQLQQDEDAPFAPDGGHYVAVVSGANMNFDRLRHIAERAELGDDAEALLAVTIPERAGSFRDFLHCVGRRIITEFNYRYATSQGARLFVGIQLAGAGERAALVAQLRGGGYEVLDMTGNEMAKMHVRFMVGGHAPGLADERLYRFEFPERPGACLDFLHAIGGRWNISLFNYRNHGAAYGRVLCGLQVPETEQAECDAALQQLGYPYWDESDNPAYRLFLGT